VNTRQSKLLQAIIDQFIATGLPVGSKAIIESGFFEVSGATIRNEMQALSEKGFISQTHISSGRVPTALGYRLYVKEFMEPTKEEKMVKRKFESLKQQYLKRKDQERVYEAVALLSHMTPNVAFASVPHRSRVFYMGLANVLRQPEFAQDSKLASIVAEVLEDRLADLLAQMEIDDQVRYSIGEQHILEQLQSCAMLVTSYNLRGEQGEIGILGPMRMDYAFNTVALEMAAELLRS
jgi:transcriptional regulator of heat shock response